ncbi:MAG: glycine zipper 2TM domain-containing protein [Sulfuritalea sp.]|jgi:outer membrane lipoprotein SlyB|nr:glycine zipper 2TM domain-containing protein [Sulfuritalea sp.]
MHKRIVLGWFALVALFPLAFSANPAHAQHSVSSAATARIDGFDVEPVKRATPGSELVFTLYGSPGGTAAVQIGGATGGVVLAETEAGVYEGIYTIRQRDRITAASTATANLRVGNRVASAILDEPLVGTGRPQARAAPSAAAPKIDRFDVDPPARLAVGEELILTLSGSPGGAASARIAGVKGKIVLNEIKTGVYEGSHIIKSRDRIAANAVVTGNLRIANRETSAVLDQSLVAGSQHRPNARQAARLCVNCGVVEAINVIEVKGQGSYLGPIAGGVAGALLGSQVGHGAGNTIATVVGAAGGAYAGGEIEKRAKTTKHYEVVVRLDNGGSKTFSYAAQPGFAVGAKVKVANGTLTVVQ